MHEQNTMPKVIIVSFSIHFFKYFIFFSFLLHKKIMEQFDILLCSFFFPRRESTRQVFIKVLYNVQTFTSTVPTECRRYHRDFLFFSFHMKRCKATEWYRDEVQKEVKKQTNNQTKKKQESINTPFIHPSDCTWTWYRLAHRKPGSTF